MEPAGPAVQHRPFGSFCMKGAHIKQDERIYGATLLDVTPTILTLFGLPVGEDMDGRVLVQAFDKKPEIARIPSWETEAGECGMHPEGLRMDPAAAQLVLKQFVALGYIQPPSENQEKAAEIAMRELRYNLSRAYLDARNYSEALLLLEELAKKWPEETRFQQYLAQCYLAMGRRAEAKTILEQLIAAPPKKRVRRKPDATEGEIPTQDAETTPVEAVEIEDTAPRARPWADLFMGIIHFEEGETDEALSRLLKAEDADPRLPDLHLRIGETYLRKKRIEDAERAFERALEIDGDSPEAHLGLALVRLRQRRNEEAAEQSLIAVGLQHFLPLGHFYLGVALARLGHRERAILAFETALSMMPGLLAAHRWLAALYNHPQGSREKAAGHRFLYAQLKRQREVAANS